MSSANKLLSCRGEKSWRRHFLEFSSTQRNSNASIPSPHCDGEASPTLKGTPGKHEVEGGGGQYQALCFNRFTAAGKYCSDRAESVRRRKKPHRS